MTEKEARGVAVAAFLEKAERALAAARREHEAKDYELAVNRLYYASFYALTAVLLRDRRVFSKHSGARAALHQYLVKPGKVPRDSGTFYDEAFEMRQEADYGTMPPPDPALIADKIRNAERFVAEMHRVLAAG